MRLKEETQKALKGALKLCEWIAETPHQSGSINGLAAQVEHALRAALAKDAMQQLTDEQQKIEAVTDCHEKAGDNLPPPFDRPADTGKTSDHIADASKMVATINESETVEPVAYVTGFSKGYAVVQPVDRSLLMPVGMALYRLPPTSQQFRQVEPVLYLNGRPLFDVPPPLMPLQWNKAPVKTEWGEGMVEALVEIDKDHTLKLYCENDQATRVEAMIGARKPLSDEEIKAMWVAVDHRKIHQVITFVRAIERAHGIGGEE